MKALHRIVPTLFAAMSAALLTACGGGEVVVDGREVKTVGMQPLGMVLRPDETDIVRMIGNADGGQPNALVAAYASSWVDVDLGMLPCAVPAPDCGIDEVHALAGEEPREGDQLAVAFTFDPGSRTSGMSSYLPVHAFPSTPLTAPPVVRYAAGGDQDGGTSIALDADGNAWFWGFTESGATGSGRSHFPKPYRLPFAPGPGPLVAVDASLDVDGYGTQFVALAADGTVWSWGRTALDRETPSAEPQQVPGLDRAIAVAAGARHALALRDDGSVWAWGDNFAGQLGNREDGPLPRQVVGLSNIVAIAAGAHHSMALDSDGRVWGWGYNNRGQTGDVDDDSLRTPRQVAGLGPVRASDAGDSFSIALVAGGTVWGWGDNTRLQLGPDAARNCKVPDDGPCSATPRRVGGELRVVDQIAAGAHFAVARIADGTVWAWGDNSYGQLGGLPGLGSANAVQVVGLPPAINIAAGARHALMMPVAEACPAGDGRTGGRLMAWGDNYTGERGDGTAINHVRPTPVLTLGDDDRCAATIGRRLVVFLGGIAHGSVTSSAPELSCQSTLCWQTVADGSDVTLTAQPDAGAALADWRWDCAAAGSAPQATVSMNTVRHCKVRFQDATGAATRALTIEIIGEGSVNSSPFGIDCGSDCRAEFAPGTAVVLFANSATNSRFAGFEGDEGCSDRVVMDRDMRCVARFEPVGGGNLLTVQLAGGNPGAGHVTVQEPHTGIDCGEDCSESYPAGTLLFLVATSSTSPSTFFSHWTGCTDTLGRDGDTTLCIVLMNGPQTVQAHFE